MPSSSQVVSGVKGEGGDVSGSGPAETLASGSGKPRVLSSIVGGGGCCWEGHIDLGQRQGSRHLPTHIMPLHQVYCNTMVGGYYRDKIRGAADLVTVLDGPSSGAHISIRCTHTGHAPTPFRLQRRDDDDSLGNRWSAGGVHRLPSPAATFPGTKKGPLVCRLVRPLGGRCVEGEMLECGRDR